MNAYELADKLESFWLTKNDDLLIKTVTTLRQQADRIAELELQLFKVTNRTIATRKKLSKLKKEKIRACDNGFEDGRKPDTQLHPKI